MSQYSSTECLVVLLGNQLFPIETIKALQACPIFMAEDVELCTYVRHHQQKLMLFLAAMRAHAQALEQSGFSVTYHRLEAQVPLQHAPTYLDKLQQTLDKHPTVTQLILFEVEDQFFETRLKDFAGKQKLQIHFLPSPMFITSRDDFESYLIKAKHKPFMARFYQWQRKRLNILVDDDGKPAGGQWSYDADNRKKLPRKIDLPAAPYVDHSDSKLILDEVKEVIHTHFSHHPGELETFVFPVNRAQTMSWFQDFLAQRFNQFGPYEDALSQRDPWLFHSVLSPMLNMGLLTPHEVIKEGLRYAKAHEIPLNSLEGFVRQIIGWREFVRGIDRHFHEQLHESNFWDHHRQLSPAWYQAETGLDPLDAVINKTLKYGWAHHIERLMIVANLMNLCEIHPKAAYQWFMEMYVDSSDWVMAPNVMGMGLMSDGGIFASKPYICGSNYILKMSDYPKGDWCDVMDGLYWRFIEKHRDFFESNHRLSMMPRTLDKLKPERKEKIFAQAEQFIDRVTR